MDKISLNINSKNNSYKVLDISNFSEQNNSLIIKLNNNSARYLSRNDRIFARRHFTDSSIPYLLTEFDILRIVDENTIETSIPNRPSNILQYDDVEHVEKDNGVIGVNIHLTGCPYITNEDIDISQQNDPVVLTVIRSDVPETLTFTNFRIYNNIETGDWYISLNVNDEDDYFFIRSKNGVLKLNNNAFYYNDNNSNSVFFDEKITFSIFDDTYTIPIGAIEEVDYIGLNKEESLLGVFDSEYKNSAIPPVIDMEKVLVKPVWNFNDELKYINSINFVLNFRTRNSEDWSVLTNGDERGYYWNNFKDYDDILYAGTDFLKNLNFSEEDVKYQKMKFKKTFLRLSYYTSKEFGNQSLIDYSTVHFNTSKILNQLKTLGWDNTNCIFTLTNNTDKLNSSEGFYLYMYKMDLPTEENVEKTIYMKVEFNHAKYGRVIPMILPKIIGDDEEEAIPVSPANYRDCLYIPIKIKYIIKDGKPEYVYFYDFKNVTKGENTTITLIEPRLVEEGQNDRLNGNS